MKKRTMAFMACALASTIAVSGFGITTYAEGTLVSEEEISITAALDQYLAGQAVAQNTDTEAAQPADTTAVQTTEAAVAATEATTEAAQPAQTVAYPEFEGKALANVTGNLNIRSGAGEDTDRIGKLPAGAVATVVGTEGGWTQIQSGSVTGYVKSDYLVFGDEAGAYAEKNLPKMAVINTETLKVREGQSTDSACITQVPGGEEYAIIEQHDAWTEIEVDDATTGFVSNDYINVTYSLATAVSLDEEIADEEDDDDQDAADTNDNSQTTTKNDNKKNDTKKDTTSKSDKKSNTSKNTASSKSEKKETATKKSSSKSSGTRSEVVNYALQFVGNPYVYGGSSLTKGTDCSGFTMSVYNHFGVSLPHNSGSQSGCGKRVAISDIQPGDLLFYGNGKGISHVALYIGNGKVVHASSRKTGIKISQYNYKTPKCAVSVLD